jgi:hypothetical protein
VIRIAVALVAAAGLIFQSRSAGALETLTPGAMPDREALVAASSPNVAAFDIRGLRLHMEETEALAQMVRLESENPPDDPTVKDYPNNAALVRVGPDYCAQQRAAAITSPDAGQQTPRCNLGLNYSGKLYSLHVELVEDYPAHPLITRVYSIQYQVPAITSADNKAIFNAVIGKYGKPNWVGYTRSQFKYCYLLPDTSCDEKKPILFANLLFNTITLSDQTYRTTRDTAITRYLQSLRSHPVKI